MSNQVTLASIIERQGEWSDRTFGPGDRHRGVVEHIRKELNEILENPEDLEEWVDVIILALDGARRSGYNSNQIVQAIIDKQAKNRKRRWIVRGPDEPSEHDRTQDRVDN